MILFLSIGIFLGVYFLLDTIIKGSRLNVKLKQSQDEKQGNISI